MEEFLNRMNSYLDEVDQNKNQSVPEAYQELGSALTLFEGDFLATKKALDELDIISARL